MADDINNDGSGATAAPDTGGTNPQATTSTPASNTDQIDAKGRSESGELPVQGAQTTAEAFPFPGHDAPPSAQADPQASSATPEGQPLAQTPPPPPAVQAAIDKGGWTHQVLTALAGGPTTSTTIDPNTGKVIRQQVPVSNARLGMSIALAALTGAFNGLAQKGPGAEGRAAAGGFDEALQQKQQQQKDQDDEASKTYARQAAIAQTNFTMHETAQRMGMLDYDFHNKIVSNNQAGIAALDAAGAIQDRGVSEGDLLKKYNITKDSALADGVVARKNPDGTQATDKYGQPVWDNTYTVVDPSKKIALSPAMAQNLADHHVAGFFTMQDGKAVPKDFSGSSLMRANMYLNGVAQANAIDTTEAQLKQQFTRLGAAGSDEGKAFDANLTQALDKNQINPKDLVTFAKYSSMPFDKALDQMRKDKVDPQTIGNIAGLVPQKVQDAMVKQRLDQENADDAVRTATAKHVEAQSALPDQQREEEMKKKIDARFAYQESFGREHGVLDAKAKYGDEDSQKMREMVNNPKLGNIQIDPNDKPVNGARQGVLAQFQATDPGLAAEIKAIGEGRNVMSKYGLAKGDGQKLASLVQLAYPTYDSSKADSYDDLRKKFVGGKDADQFAAGRTTLQHVARLFDTGGKIAAGVPLTTAHTDFKTDAGRAVEEMNSAYTTGVLHTNDRAHLENLADSVSPSQRQEFAREGMRLLVDKISQRQAQWGFGKPSQAVSDFPLLDQNSIDAYNHVLHGESAIDEYGRVTKVAGQMKDKGGNSWYVDANRQPLYQVKDNY